MPAVVVEANHVTVRSSVILESAGQARTSAHVGGAVLPDRVEGIRADPDRVGEAIVPVALRQPIIAVRPSCKASPELSRGALARVRRASPLPR